MTNTPDSPSSPLGSPAAPSIPPTPFESEAPASAAELLSRDEAGAPSGGRNEQRSVSEPLRDRLRALLELLEDDSPVIFETVRAELEAHPHAASALARAARDERPRLRARARRILAERSRRSTMRRLFGYSARQEVVLEQALFLLGSLDRAELDTRPYVKALDAMGREVARRAAEEPDDLTRPMVLPQYLGTELGFIGSEADFHHPDNIHLHRAIERKCGMPLTLTAIYMAVAKRAGLEASPLALPGRVLLSLKAGKRTLVIDPFGGGRVRTRIDCVQYLAEHGLVPRPDWFRAASDRTMFQRQTLNLMSSCQMRGLAREARHLHRLALAIGNGG